MGGHADRFAFSSTTGRPARVVAHNVPAVGDGKLARVLGDYTSLFPEPLPVAGS